MTKKLTPDEATNLVHPHPPDSPAEVPPHPDVVAQLPDGIVWNAAAERFEKPTISVKLRVVDGAQVAHPRGGVLTSGTFETDPDTAAALVARGLAERV